MTVGMCHLVRARIRSAQREIHPEVSESINQISIILLSDGDYLGREMLWVCLISLRTSLDSKECVRKLADLWISKSL